MCRPTRPSGWEGAEELAADGLLLKRPLRHGHGSLCCDGGEACIVSRLHVPGHEFGTREETLVIGQIPEDVPSLGEIAVVALRTMREGDHASFWVDARLVGRLKSSSLWSQGRFEWVEEGYEWEVQVSRHSPARLARDSSLYVLGGLQLPRLGLGLYMVSPSDAHWATLEALRLGYRLIDTARMYENEVAVGRALRDSGVRRQDVVLVSKVNNPEHGYHEALHAIEASRSQLGVDYIDLMLIHSPLGGRVLATWDAMLEARQRGWVRHVGVSNFGVDHLQKLQAAGREMPVVNQFEVSPFCQETELRRFCQQKNIAVMGYSPLTRGARLGDHRVVGVASKHGKSPAQVLIRWALQQGIVTIPKSVNTGRLQSNIDVFDFELDGDDLARLGTCEERLHTCWDCLNVPWSD